MVRRASLLLLALAAACSRPPETAETGRVLYARHDCALCHRVGTEGGLVGPDLTFVGLRRSGGWLKAWLAEPASVKPDAVMPKPRLSPRERDGVAAYLLTLRGPLPPGLSAEKKALGGELYERMGCAACHGRGAAGDGPPHDLRDLEARPRALRGLARVHDRGSLKKRLLRNRPDAHGERTMSSLSSTLTPDQLDALAGYLLAL